MPDNPGTVVEPGVETIRLYGFETDWNQAKGPVRALLFGQMVKRAIGVVEFYHSDLYHDAQWIEENVTGATQFLWMVRRNGTNLGERAQIQEQISSKEPRVLYYVALNVSERGEYTATFSELVRVD